MGDSSQQEASQGHLYPGCGDGEALFVDPPQASPPEKPPKGTLDNPAAGHTLEARFVVETAPDVKDAGSAGGLRQEVDLSISASGAQQLAPRPALAPGGEARWRGRS